MKIKLCLGFFVLLLALSGCDKKEDPVAESPFAPFEGGDELPANCNLEVVTVKRITADDVTDEAEIGDYFFTFKSVKTVKTKISIEARYFKGIDAVSIITLVLNESVGIEETIKIKISSDDINADEDFDCLEYVVKVEANGSEDCQYVANDC